MADDINLIKDETFDEYVTEKVNVIKNVLLGDYNSSGKYIINEQVIMELLKLEKTKRSTFNNSIFCTSFMPGMGEITFELELKKQGDNGIAVIYVLEKVDKINGYIQNTLKTQIAIYKDVLTPDFIDRSFEGFNIVRNNGEQKELDPEDFKDSLNTYIGARKHFMDLLDNATADDYNNMYQQYFNQRVAILKEDGSEYSNLVLKKYAEEYDKIKDYFLKNEGAIDYKALNELLDKCFEDVNGLDPKYREKEEELKKKMVPYLHALMMQAQAITKKGKEKVVQKAKASEKQKMTQIAMDKEKVEKSKSKPKEKDTKFTYGKAPASDSGIKEHPINDDERFKSQVKEENKNSTMDHFRSLETNEGQHDQQDYGANAFDKNNSNGTGQLTGSIYSGEPVSGGNQNNGLDGGATPFEDHTHVDGPINNTNEGDGMTSGGTDISEFL